MNTQAPQSRGQWLTMILHLSVQSLVVAFGKKSDENSTTKAIDKSVVMEDERIPKIIQGHCP